MTFVFFITGLGISILLIVAWMLCWMAGRSDEMMAEILKRETGENHGQ